MSGRSRWLLALLVVEALALAAFRAPDERFYRYAFADSGAELVVQDLLRRGYRPTLDFGYLYGLLPALVGRAWYGLLGPSPQAFRGLALAGSLVTVWGLARFADASRPGPAGIALFVLAVPDVLLPAAITLVHVLEPALLVHALAEHARGRRSRALAIVTACLFVKPGLAYFYGLFLVIALVAAAWAQGRAAWVRAFGPAALTALVLAAILAAAFGPAPLVRSLFPLEGPADYRANRYGFFHGVGRDFWILPGAGLRDYFRYETGFWLLGSLLLTAGGLAALGRVVARRAATIDDELVACAAGLHAAFVTLLFANRTSWVYDFAILIVGLAALPRRGRWPSAAVWGLTALLLVSDRSKLAATAREWSILAPSPATLGLWASPRERAEWSTVSALTQGSTRVLLARNEGAALLSPGFAPPVGGYFYTYARPSEIRRKAAQLTSAAMIVRAVPRDWRGFTRWPELAAALHGCEIVWEAPGGDLAVYRRARHHHPDLPHRPSPRMNDVARASRIAGMSPVARLSAFFIAEVVVLTLLQAPNELFFRFAFGDSGASLTIQDLIRRGYRPTIDFGYIYGLLPLLIHRLWFILFGATPQACWWATLICNVVMAWGLARFAVAQRVGWAGVALLALAVPDLLRSSYDVLVQVLEPALLVHALAEQARGRRGRALALVTAAAFVKPSMAYVFGLYLLIAIARTIHRTDRAAWRQALVPAFVTGTTLAVVLAAVYGVRPLVNTLIPGGGMEVYRQGRLGFFHGTGRAFWVRPGAGLRGYLRYEIGYWLAGTLVLIGGGLESLVKLSRRVAPKVAHNDEVVLGCAVLHVAFVTLFFGHSFSWKYYLAIFLLGLAALTSRGRRHMIVVAGIAVLVLVSDRAWVQALVHDWKGRSPSPVTLGLWSTPEERREWARVLELTRGDRPVLLADCDGAALLFPQFAPPMGAYFVPGHPLPPEVRRKAAQLAKATTIVKVAPPGDRRFQRWPELAAAFDGCTPVWEGNLYQVYRRTRPAVPSPSLR